MSSVSDVRHGDLVLFKLPYYLVKHSCLDSEGRGPYASAILLSIESHIGMTTVLYSSQMLRVPLRHVKEYCGIS